MQFDHVQAWNGKIKAKILQGLAKGMGMHVKMVS